MNVQVKALTEVHASIPLSYLMLKMWPNSREFLVRIIIQTSSLSIPLYSTEEQLVPF